MKEKKKKKRIFEPSNWENKKSMLIPESSDLAVKGPRGDADWHTPCYLHTISLQIEGISKMSKGNNYNSLF